MNGINYLFESGKHSSCKVSNSEVAISNVVVVVTRFPTSEMMRSRVKTHHILLMTLKVAQFPLSYNVYIFDKYLSSLFHPLFRRPTAGRL